MDNDRPIFYKATRPDGKDFYSGTLDYAAALASGAPITVPKSGHYECCTSTVLHASVSPTETLIGGTWPCRLFEVTGEVVATEGHKRGFQSLTVLAEVDAHLALGPQGTQICGLIERAGSLTLEEAQKLGAARGAAWDAARDAARGAAWDAAWDAARGAARGAAWDAARDAAWDAAWDAARDAARGAAWDAARDAACLVSRDLIGDRFTQEHYDLLTGPWRRVIGPIHPDDADLRSQ